MMILSSLLAVVFTICGLVFSYFYDVSSGASIIIVSILALVLVKGFYAIK
jgi:zinc transport system permease protein